MSAVNSRCLLTCIMSNKPSPDIDHCSSVCRNSLLTERKVSEKASGDGDAREGDGYKMRKGEVNHGAKLLPELMTARAVKT